MEQKSIKVETKEPTAQEFLESLNSNNGKMDLLNEAMGLSNNNKKEDKSEIVEKPEEKTEPVKEVKEDNSNENKEEKKQKKDNSVDKLSNALGLVKKEDKNEIKPEDKNEIDYEKIMQRNQELEKTIAVSEETSELENILESIPVKEAEILIKKVEELISSPLYSKLKLMTPKERAAILINNAKGLAVNEINEINESELNAEKTLKKIISGPDANPSGGVDDKKRIKDLRKKANEGDMNAQEEFLYESLPGAKDFIDSILKNMG